MYIHYRISRRTRTHMRCQEDPDWILGGMPLGVQAQRHCSSTGQEMHFSRAPKREHPCKEVQGPHQIIIARTLQVLPCVAWEPREEHGWGRQAHAPADVVFHGADAEECSPKWNRSPIEASFVAFQTGATVHNLDEVIGICNLACTACSGRGRQTLALLFHVLEGRQLTTCPSAVEEVETSAPILSVKFGF